MEIVHTMNIGEAIVGGGTILLAFAAFATIMQAKCASRKRIQREHKLRLLDTVVKWLMEIMGTVHEEEVETRPWTPPPDFLSMREGKSKLLKKLLHLSSVGRYYLLECKRPFNKYKFEKMASKYIDSFGEYTNKLHDVVEARSEKSWPEDYDDDEIKFENATNDFLNYIIEIREKENL
jgi:hypothetical protein